MRTSQKKFVDAVVHRVLVLCLILVPLCMAAAGDKKDSAKGAVNGHYQGTAKNRAEEVIQVTFELAEKEGAMSGMIRSDHGDFTITGGWHKGDDVTLDFDANGSTGTITLKLAEDKLSGTWTAGDDGGPVDVKKAVAQEEAPKGKS
jgi:hypothetical protein